MGYSSRKHTSLCERFEESHYWGEIFFIRNQVGCKTILIKIDVLEQKSNLGRFLHLMAIYKAQHEASTGGGWYLAVTAQIKIDSKPCIAPVSEDR